MLLNNIIQEVNASALIYNIFKQLIAFKQVNFKVITDIKSSKTTPAVIMAVIKMFIDQV